MFYFIIFIIIIVVTTILKQYCANTNATVTVINFYVSLTWELDTENANFYSVAVTVDIFWNQKLLLVLLQWIISAATAQVSR